MRRWGTSGGKWSELDQLDAEAAAAAAAASSTFAGPAPPADTAAAAAATSAEPSGNFAGAHADTASTGDGSGVAAAPMDAETAAAEQAAGAAVQQSAAHAGGSWGGGDGVSRIAAGVEAIDLSLERGLEGVDACSEECDGASAKGDGAAGPGADDEDARMAGGEQDGDQGAEEGDDGDWETAGSSRNAERRRKKKVQRLMKGVSDRVSTRAS